MTPKTARGLSNGGLERTQIMTKRWKWSLDAKVSILDDFFNGLDEFGSDLGIHLGSTFAPKFTKMR